MRGHPWHCVGATIPLIVGSGRIARRSSGRSGRFRAPRTCHSSCRGQRSKRRQETHAEARGERVDLLMALRRFGIDRREEALEAAWRHHDHQPTRRVADGLEAVHRAPQHDDHGARAMLDALAAATEGDAGFEDPEELFLAVVKVGRRPLACGTSASKTPSRPFVCLAEM